MRLQSLLLQAPLLATASPTFAPQVHERTDDTKSIQWKSCQLPGQTPAIPIECGTLKVPLDYSDKDSDEKLQLDIFRVKATSGKNKGSIFLNFGGPGADGAADLAFYSGPILASTGGEHDLINVVPRGTGYTLPFSCFNDTASKTFSTKVVGGDASNTALADIWANAALYDQSCLQAQNETGRYIGTAFVVRDMFKVLDSLDEDGMLRYWGVSYGTVLGATAVAMFPDKVDKVILDGVVNAHEYYQNKETELYTDTDKVFAGFCSGCVSAPKECPLAGNYTSEELQKALIAQMEALKQAPIPVPVPGYPGGGLVIDYSFIKGYISRQLYFPFQWPSLAKQLDALIKGDLAGLIEAIGGDGSSSTAPTNTTWNPPNFDDSLYGIKCSDIIQDNTYEEMLPVFQGRIEMGAFGGVAAQMPARCAQWPMRAKERYDGDFKVKSKNPVLVIGNTYDPVTPLASARNMTKTFDGAVLLQYDSYGHDSLTLASECTAKAVRAYFNEGKLPEEGTICDTKVPKWSTSDGWTDVIKKMGQK